jgi:predicted metalloprotease with PDZ domain
MVDNLSSLSNGMLFAGTHEEFVVKRQDFELVFAFGGSEIIKQKESFKNMTEGVLDYYINLMGGVPNPSPDDKFSKAIVVLNPSVQTDGEVIGNNISILLEEGGDDMSQMIARFIFAHEFFHLWNGKSFTPENEDCEWFKEGFTNYYTLKALYHIGFLNQESFLGVLNSFFYQRYDKDPGLGSISMTQGDQKHDHWGLIYSGGFFAAISQDMIIRSATDNNKSIDDVMRILFVKYGGTDHTYTLTELEKLFSEASGEDQSEFFKSFIKGNSRIPLANYLNMAGFTAAEEEGQLGVSVKEELSPVEEKIVEGFFGKL